MEKLVGWKIGTTRTFNTKSEHQKQNESNGRIRLEKARWMENRNNPDVQHKIRAPRENIQA